MTTIKQYKNSKGEDLPKEINEVVNAESQRLGQLSNLIHLSQAFDWRYSNYFKEDSYDSWKKVWNGDYLQFYLACVLFPFF